MREFAKIVTRLRETAGKEAALTRRFRDDADKHFDRLDAMAQDAQMDEAQLMKTKRELEAYQKIAKAQARGRRLPTSTGPRPLDRGVLARLAVQVAGGSAAIVDELYLETCGQLEMIERLREVRQQQLVQEQDEAVNRRLASNDVLFNKMAELSEELGAYLKTAEVTSFLKRLSRVEETFGGNADTLGDEPLIPIGRCRVAVPMEPSLCKQVGEAFGKAYDVDSATFFVPYYTDFSKDHVYAFDYTNDTEEEILGGLQHWVANLLKYQKSRLESVCFFDPVRFNNTAMGCLSAIMGDGMIMENVCRSDAEIAQKVEELLKKGEQALENGKHEGYTLLIAHDYPEAYSAQVQEIIQQLAVNAKSYCMRLVLTQNRSRDKQDSDELKFLESRALCMDIGENGFAINDKALGGAVPFRWYAPVASLPSVLEDGGRRVVREEKNLDNVYQNRVEVCYPKFAKKGVRKIENIPLSVDENGNVVTVDFENTNFAAFVCGASRSGKSTMLHTLITGLLMNNHPDDIEIWLIDFKMTEFSRYLENTPPHIRYIALDESPEMVYDIIDRLSSILTQRQNMFKGKWEKIKDVPRDKYMPNIFVIIDEFSIMSNVLADSVGSNDNYVIKLQNIMSRGAAFGFKFIFASQGFDNGTRGLNEFSKNQIQQRIAMRTDYEEVKATLDLKSVSERDQLLMETLPIYHVLLKHNPDSQGNRLDLSKVLFLSDDTIQPNLIRQINDTVQTTKRYDPDDLSTYIYKQPLFVDGNRYLSFEAREADFDKYLAANADELMDTESYALSIGEPRRMKPISPIRIANEFSENMLIVGPNTEKAAISSIFRSMLRSAQKQELPVYLWGKANVPAYRLLYKHLPQSRCRKGLEEICDEIKTLKRNIRHGIRGDGIYVLVGLESLLTEMEYIEESGGFEEEFTASSEARVVYQPRAEGEPDLLQQMRAAASGHFTMPSVSEAVTPDALGLFRPEATAKEYDAREDLKYILANGPKKGYHFVLLFNTSAEYKQSRLSIEMFKHKVMFVMSRDNAYDLNLSRDAAPVSQLIPRTFRYTNGLEGVNFRPFMHEGLSWDGWEYENGEAVMYVQEEDTYLM